MQTVSPRMPSSPAVLPPPGSCDCHAHVFGPYDRFPLDAAPPYPPPLAPAALHRDMLERAGLSRGVLVQPGAYGLAPDSLLAALAEGGGRLRGVALADASIGEHTLAAWHAAGVRGLRFVEMTVPGGTGRYPGSVPVDQLAALAPTLRALGLHAEVWATIDQAAALLPLLRASGVPVVLDHMAGMQAGRPVDDPAFRAVRDALGEGWLWVKLALCRASRAFPDYGDIRPIHDALLHAAPERMLWGSDWPHLRLGDTSPDVSHLLGILRDWACPPLADRVLVDNPAALYGFR